MKGNKRKQTTKQKIREKNYVEKKKKIKAHKPVLQ
jgi:hypothetical protein